MSPYFQLIYCSRRPTSSDEIGAADVRDILAVAREDNARDDITGALLVDADCFAQLLEGPADKVEALFERIRLDPRHQDVVVLCRQTVVERVFPDWSMGYASPVESDEIDRTARVFANAFYAPGPAAAAEVRELIVSAVAQVQLW